MRIFLLGNGNKEGVKEEAKRLKPFLEKYAEIAVFDLWQQHDLNQEADLALVLGGDGAILRAARQMGYQQKPVLGVNLGKLGFLADLNPDELESYFPSVARGEYRVVYHLMFECTIESKGSDATHVTTPAPILGLNEVAIQAGYPFHMIDLDLCVNDEPVSRISGDGLIVSTPIGSTAHNLSAGGPILGQELSAFVITPICPHSLTNRPVVDSADKSYTIDVVDGGSSSALVIDGQEIIPLQSGDHITVRKAPVSFALVKVPGRSYYQTLRDKLHWGTQPNYRREPLPKSSRNTDQPGSMES
ncbi:MAG: NAD kinase [Gemmatales bacterium]|nr:MAG: NAD kinase [Gemmatales bacterium]